MTALTVKKKDTKLSNTYISLTYRRDWPSQEGLTSSIWLLCMIDAYFLDTPTTTNHYYYYYYYYYLEFKVRFFLPVYRMSQEEWTKLREGVTYVKLYRYNPKHLCPKLNSFRDNGKWSLKLWQLLHTYWLSNSYWNWQEYVVSVMLISVLNIKVTCEWHKAI